MTQQQRREIENQFYAYKDSDNSLWRTVFENTMAKFRYDIEETILRMYYIEHRKQYNICKTLCISKRNFYYHLQKIIDFAYMVAKDKGLI